VAWGQWLAANVLAAGATLKIYDQAIDNSSSLAAALDLAALYRNGLPGLQLGLALQNLGAGVAGFNLPMNVKAGAAYKLPQAFEDGDTWRFLADVNAPLADMSYLGLSVGTEYMFDHAFALRLGYTAKNSSGLDGVTGLSGGLGVFLGPVNLDYALVTFGDLGLTHQLMVTWTFDQPAAPSKTTKTKTKHRSTY
jgi:hypothetical protein